MSNSFRESRMTLGRHLEAARRQAGYSLRQLAALSGVPMSSVNRLLKDEVAQPTPEHLMALARVLECRDTDLFILAGLPIPAQGASLEVMLRRSYGVRVEDTPRLKQQIEDLIRQAND
jgi:transcriptional regulator with XRE-family HTH domain